MWCAVVLFYGILKYKKNIVYYQNTCKNIKLHYHNVMSYTTTVKRVLVD